MIDDSLLRETVLVELKGRLNELLGEGTARLVLYGSQARGDYDSGSDLDVAIIVPSLTRELKNRILATVADLEIERLAPLSALVLSEEDFESLKKKERRLALDIEREGIVL